MPYRNSKEAYHIVPPAPVVTPGYCETHLLALGRVSIEGMAVALGRVSPLLLLLALDASSGADTSPEVLSLSTCREVEAIDQGSGTSLAEERASENPDFIPV